MGYYTDFDGIIEISPELKPDDAKFLRGIANTRRMARNLGPEYGIEGEFFFDLTDSMFGQRRTPDIIDYNSPPRTQPSLWCPWELEGDSMLWIPENGKHYEAPEWLVYLIERILKPRGYTCSGSVMWFGEDREDIGRITVKDNVVLVERGAISFSHAEVLQMREYQHTRFERTAPCLPSSPSQ